MNNLRNDEMLRLLNNTSKQINELRNRLHAVFLFNKKDAVAKVIYRLDKEASVIEGIALAIASESSVLKDAIGDIRAGLLLAEGFLETQKVEITA